MAARTKKDVEIKVVDRATQTLRLLSSRFSKFSASLKSVKMQAAAVGKSIGQITTVVGGVTAAVAAGIKKVSDYGDSMLTLAGIVNMPVENLQKLRYAAIQNDVSAQQFDDAIKKLSKSMGELSHGEGALYSKLSKTNPALLRQLKAANGVEGAFRVMMKAIGDANTTQEKAFLATAAFEESGQNLISLANIGADSMAQWEAEAEKFGVITEQDAAAMDQFNKSIDRVKAVAMGLAATITTKVLPAIKPIVDQFADWVAENRELIASKVADVVRQLADMFKQLMAVLKPLLWLFSNFTWVLGVLFYAKVGSVILKIGALGKTILGLVPAFASGVKALGLFTSGISTGSRVLAILHGLIGKRMFNKLVKLGTFVWGAVKAFLAWNAALFANPITWIVLGIVALIAAIAAAAYAIYTYWEPIKDFFKKLWDGICDIFQGAYDFIAGIFKSIKEWVSELWFVKTIKWIGRVTGITDSPDDISGTGPMQPVAQSPAYSPLNPNSFNQSQLNIATMGAMSKQSADISVRFDNLPTGTKIDSQSSDTNLDLEIYRGANGGTI